MRKENRHMGLEIEPIDFVKMPEPILKIKLLNFNNLMILPEDYENDVFNWRCNGRIVLWGTYYCMTRRKELFKKSVIKKIDETKPLTTIEKNGITKPYKYETCEFIVEVVINKDHSFLLYRGIETGNVIIIRKGFLDVIKRKLDYSRLRPLASIINNKVWFYGGDIVITSIDDQNTINLILRSLKSLCKDKIQKILYSIGGLYD